MHNRNTFDDWIIGTNHTPHHSIKKKNKKKQSKRPQQKSWLSATAAQVHIAHSPKRTKKYFKFLPYNYFIFFTLRDDCNLLFEENNKKKIKMFLKSTFNFSKTIICGVFILKLFRKIEDRRIT